MSDQYDEKDMSRIGEILANENVWADPPGHIAPALMAEITGDEIASRPSDEPRARSRWLWPAAAAFAGAAAVLLVVFLGGFGSDPEEPGLLFAVTGEGVTGQAEVGPAEAGWWIRIVDMKGLDPAPHGSYYEGWLTDGTDLVSVGTFHMRDGESVVLWSGVPMSDYPDFTVTLELIADGPGPSGDVVASGHLTD